MNFQEIVQQLNDLPATFRRDSAPYTWLIDSLAAGLYLFCQASDALQSQYNFGTSAEGWLDVWGDLAGISRTTNEPNSLYQNRIFNTVLAWRDSPVAIEKFIQVVEHFTANVTERYPVGYTIAFPFLFDRSTIQRVILDLKYVRPAGVPFEVVSQIGTYLNTVNYYGHIGINYLTAPSGKLVFTSIVENETIIGDFTFDSFGNLVSSQANVFTGNIDGSYFLEDTYLSTVNYAGHIGTYYLTTSGGSGMFTFAGQPIPLTPPVIGRVTGAYIADREPLSLSLPATTNNVEDIIPDLLFTAPILNPGL